MAALFYRATLLRRTRPNHEKNMKTALTILARGVLCLSVLSAVSGCGLTEPSMQDKMMARAKAKAERRRAQEAAEQKRQAEIAALK